MCLRCPSEQGGRPATKDVLTDLTGNVDSVTLKLVGSQCTGLQKQAFVQRQTGRELSMASVYRIFNEIGVAGSGSDLSPAVSSFRRLDSLCEVLMDMLPGTTAQAEWHREDMGGDGCALRFNTFTILLGCSVTYCNMVGINIVQIDAGFISGSPLHGWRLLVLCVSTGSDMVLPLAMKVCAAESCAHVQDMLEFVVQHGLRPALAERMPGEATLAFLRDGGAALRRGIQNVFGDAMQRDCLAHLGRLLKSKAGALAGQVLALFWAACTATNTEDTKAWLSLIQKLHQPSYDKLMEVGIDSWAATACEEHA